MKKRFLHSIYFSLLTLVNIWLTGCSTPKNITYFQDLQDTILTQTAQPVPFKVEPGDKLSIIVKSKDKALSDLFNLPVVTSRIGQASGPSDGIVNRSYLNTSEGIAYYTVTPEGTIDFPVLGSIKIAGMTRSEVAGFIKGELMGRDLVKDPVVTVEFLTAGVSVLGEVNHPGRYEINRDELSLLDALALAGDLTINGKRENVSVIRKEADGVHTYRINLTKVKDMVKSPAYYLKQGDIVYIEPNNVKKRQTTANGNNFVSAGFWISVASVLTSIAVLIFK